MGPGTVIADKYRLEAVIGTGATGVVWRATQLGLDRFVAVKVLHPGQMIDPSMRGRFRREARVAGTLSHPGAVAVLDFGDVDDTMYLVMELLVGESLRTRLEARPIELGEAATIGCDIATALLAAHRINLVHRDIKPENVVLEPAEDGTRVRVVDFGLAFIAAEGGHNAGTLGRLTLDGTISGTPAYMSPEQVREEDVGPATDIYALGCVLYEMFSGSPPFAGKLVDLLARHATANPVPLRRVAPDRAIDPDLDALVLSMLAKSPLLRPALDHVVTTLARFADQPRGGRGGRDRRVTERPVTKAAPLDLVWHGPADAALAALLGEAQVVVHTRAPMAGELAYAPGIDLAALQALATSGVRVVTDLAATDVGALVQRLRAGAADVVTRPVRADDLVHKLHRLARGTRGEPLADPSLRPVAPTLRRS